MRAGGRMLFYVIIDNNVANIYNNVVVCVLFRRKAAHTKK